VICADGLSHPSVAEHADLASQVHAASRVGVQALVSATAADYPGGVLTMMGGLGGYLGVTAVDGNSLNLAAAIDPRRLSRHYGPCDAVTDLLTENGLPVPGGLAEARWTGTPALSRKSRRASLRRLFLIGDAAGYVEPFTGEGMSWALASALAVSPLATSAAREWTDDLGRVWTGVLKQKVFRQQWMCHLLSRLLRRPRLATAALETCHALPWLRNWALRQAGVSPC
jgi:flavin-dependent dehydrogenase